MTISYICNRDKEKKNVTIQFCDINKLDKDSGKVLSKIKERNKKCCELNKHINKIARYNKLSSLMIKANIDKELLVDLNDFYEK